jgi:hypothetical protein
MNNHNAFTSYTISNDNLNLGIIIIAKKRIYVPYLAFKFQT